MAMILTPFGALQFRTCRRWPELVEPTPLQRQGHRLLWGNHPETYYWDMGDRANNNDNGASSALTCATCGISTKQGLHHAQRQGAHSCRPRCSVSSSQRSTKSSSKEPQGQLQSLKRRLRSPKEGFLLLHATSTLLWVSRQRPCPAVSELPDHTIAWAKSLKIHPSIKPSLSFSLSISPSLSPFLSLSLLSPSRSLSLFLSLFPQNLTGSVSLDNLIQVYLIYLYSVMQF